MTIKHQETHEERAFWRLVGEMEEMLSEAARTVLSGANGAAYAEYMVHNYCFQPEQYDDAMDKMRLAAAKLSDRDRELLGKLWRAALAAASSIDADDYETLAGFRVYRVDLHQYYRMLSGMVEEILYEKRIDELHKELAESEPVEDVPDPPF